MAGAISFSGAGIAVGLAASLASCATAPLTPALADQLVLDRVNVVDVRDGTIARNRAIVIADGKIVRIVAAGSVRSAAKVDGQDAYVVPGFNDMHAHNLNTASPETSLPAMLASGVTGFRQMAPPNSVVDLGPASRSSPALLGKPGPLLAGPAFASPARAKVEVDRQKADGVDFVKVVDLPAPAFLAAAEAAHAAGLPFAGHLPATVDPRLAYRARWDGLKSDVASEILRVYTSRV